MVSFVRVAFRVAHIVGAMTFLALQINTILRTEPATNDKPLVTINPLPAFGIKAPITMSAVMITEITSTIVVLAGGVNAMLLKPRVNMANTPKQSKQWRLMVYAVKGALFLLTTPAAKSVVKLLLVPQASPATAANTLEIDRTAAVIRAAAIIIGAVMGAYARYYREEATALSNAIGTQQQQKATKQE